MECFHLRSVRGLEVSAEEGDSGRSAAPPPTKTPLAGPAPGSGHNMGINSNTSKLCLKNLQPQVSEYAYASISVLRVVQRINVCGRVSRGSAARVMSTTPRVGAFGEARSCGGMKAQRLRDVNASREASNARVMSWAALVGMHRDASIARFFGSAFTPYLGLESCIERVWRDTIVYLDSNDPIFIGRAYGRVSRHLLHEELLRRCHEYGVMCLDSKVEQIIEASNGCSIVVCEKNLMIRCRLAIVASGAASGKLLEYDVGGPRVSVQTAYGVEVEVGTSYMWKTYPYDPRLMVFMDYRDHAREKRKRPEAEYPTFLYAMPMSSTRVFFEVIWLQETCLASRNAMPFDLLKRKLMSRLETMGVKVLKIYEEEWSYIPVGGSLPNTKQKNLAFGAAASMVHPATGYSVAHSLSEAPNYASVIPTILKKDIFPEYNSMISSAGNPSMLAWKTLWPQERKRQRAFFLFGLALILQLDIEGIRSFFQTFFRLPKWMWQGFLGSTLSSVDLIWFAFYMFAIAPQQLENVPCQASAFRSHWRNHVKDILNDLVNSLKPSDSFT
ncbi:lycopene epsilon cyclase, chloroplastic isoform X1 [Canna indica]|uniref:Lycopene epsilon cyclase, chloroplastic isoform X1 n=1 Tax=Canna indica TaxID=4628 RepID=A0AAQ3Q4C0_9LILI|nr:lycopene epsilon cyclase, chloroplastic isoform X1 [Canna indica]